MKYEDKYPDSKLLDEVEPLILKTEIVGACEICGDQTIWIEIDYQAHLCSDECRQKLDEGYYSELSELPIRDKAVEDDPIAMSIKMFDDDPKCL
jgi:endogenous inhibitor of DNA gyrase (YacG/DUF329 family)